MKLYLVHCGFYDMALGDGLYESHMNFFVAAESFEDARVRAKELSEYRERRMHVDGVQEVEAVGGYRVNLASDPTLAGASLVTSHRHRDLAPKPAPQ